MMRIHNQHRFNSLFNTRGPEYGYETNDTLSGVANNRVFDAQIRKNGMFQNTQYHL